MLAIVQRGARHAAKTAEASKVLIDEDTTPKPGVFATNQKLRYFKHNAKQHYEDPMMHQLKAKAGADATRNANEQMQVASSTPYGHNRVEHFPWV
jgi:hypothetical protein